MARPRTVARVHDAVLELVTEHGHSGLTMEGIAARAGVGKQTLYRTWSSVPAILFDALLTRTSPNPETTITAATPKDRTEEQPPSGPGSATERHPPGDGLPERLESLLREAIAEISTEPHESLFRSLAATIQHDPELAREYRERLLEPQLDQFHTLLRGGGIVRAQEAAELLLAPIFYRWFMRVPPMDDLELREHVRRVLDATG